MGKIYLGSDWHFSRKRKTGEMSFKYTEGKDILNKYEKMVNDDDLFIFLGDFTYFGPENLENINILIREFSMLPGTKVLIKGNNDECSNSIYREIGFSKVYDKLKIGNILFTHKPDYITKNEINIHGHIHGEDRYWDVEPLNHTDCYTKKFGNYPVEILDLLYNEKNIPNKDIIDTKVINRIYNKLY